MNASFTAAMGQIVGGYITCCNLQKEYEEMSNSARNQRSRDTQTQHDLAVSCVHNAYDSLTIILLRFSLDSRQVSPEFSCQRPDLWSSDVPLRNVTSGIFVSLKRQEWMLRQQTLIRLMVLMDVYGCLQYLKIPQIYDTVEDRIGQNSRIPAKTNNDKL